MRFSFFQGVMSKACSWMTLEKQLSDENYRNNLINCLPIRGGTFTKFDDDVLRESLIQNNNFNSSSTQSFLEHQTKNVDGNGFQTLYLQHEDVYKYGIKSMIFNHLRSVLRKAQDTSSSRSRTVHFMNFVMDEATHLKNFPQPVDCSLVRFVVAEHDAYVPRDNITSPCDIWPGCTVEYINTGHVAASLNHQDVFRKAIKHTMDRLQ